MKFNASAEKIVDWSEKVTATYTIQTKPAAPTFLPDGGEVDADEKITLTTTTEGAKIYYSTTATFVNIATEEELENNGEVMMYDENAKPALSDFWDSEMAGVNPSISAASVLIAGNGGLTWSEVTTKEFIVKAKVEPEPAVAKPVITPGNDAEVHIGDTVKIVCETEGAKIYYTTDGTEATKEAAEYTVPFALTESMLVEQNNSYSLRIRAVAAKDDEVSEGASADYVVYPNAPVFTPAAGIVSKGTDVSITCVPSQAKIYYTTDGTMPTEEATEYTAPITITEAMTIKAVAVLGQYETHDSAAYTIGVGMQLALEPAKGYVKKGQALECTVPESVLEQYGNAFVLYVENNDVALEGDYMDLWKAATGGVGQVSGAGDVNLPFQVTSVGLDDENNEVVWTKPVVISENAPAEVKFRARMAVLDSANAEKNEDGEIVTFPLLYSNEIITTYYTEVPAPVFEPAHGLVKAGQQLGCTVSENFDWEQGDNTAFLVYVENNDTLKLEEVSAGEIVADMESAEERAYKVAVCVRDFDDDDNPVYEWMNPVVLSEDANGVIKFRARLVMMTQSQGENTAAFSDEVNAVYYTELPAARFEEADEVLQSDALNVEFPAEVDFSYYLDQAFILYVENNSEAVLEYNGTMGELQALAQGGSPALPDVPEESSLTALSAKAALPYRVAVYDAEWEEWNPSVFVTTLGEVNVRARLAVATGWDSTLTYSDEFTATYTVKERPRPNKPTVMADNKEVTGETLKVKKGAALGFKSGYEDNDDYFVCYVIDGKDEDFANATMTGITMGTSSVKMYDPDFDNLAIDSAMNVKAATVQELASGDLWWSEITTVSFTVEFDTVETPAFSVAAGEVEKGTKVTISCATGEAKIYYTVDGSEPTAESTEYTAEISIDSAMTIKAIAVKEGMENSKVAEAAYTVKTVANEGEELTGVSVYPNPNTGVFYIELPVDATIDIFATNGVLVRSI
ncbi:MAG: chitobiase/beta-hexosaminidase C-terminal domain-containing protein, partial [Bacteroidales bacterium]|nr:chitobiase/beta-hexosaminidase C-terminal domain-containing protein [Bacteroidales bacterium]